MIRFGLEQPAELMLNPTVRVNRSVAQGGPKPTLRTLFDSEESRLLRYAFALTGRRAVAEDIVQEVFLQLHLHWDQVETPQAWLFRSVRNRAYNHLRNHQRETGGGDQHEPTSHDESPETMALALEATAALRQIVEDLQEPDRTLVKLKYFENLKYREISDQTGLSISNVGYRLHHVLKELATKLRPLGIDKMP